MNDADFLEVVKAPDIFIAEEIKNFLIDNGIPCKIIEPNETEFDGDEMDVAEWIAPKISIMVAPEDISEAHDLVAAFFGDQLDENTEDSGSYDICPNCGEALNDEYMVCPYCGTNLNQ
jgi:hypothetical protein